ncbi:MAG: RecQ family zinc-binding domain-containing protein, partial [Chitinophagaceae bacterium]|nr:RecQ family zinc-binding domain-containing protein [Chitinophagaceae bacterium]
TLKVLEQEGHITFAENIFLPTKICFTVSAEALRDFETAHPGLEALIKYLLRTYEGIIDNRVSVSEKQLARICRMEPQQVNEQLRQLAAFGIIEWLPQKETPQVHYLLNRAPAKYLHIAQDSYLERKKQYQQRVDTMIRYLELEKECRSKFIAHYFGDDRSGICGVCDNCLANKRKTLSPEEFNTLRQLLIDRIDSPVTVKELLASFRQYSQEKIWVLLEFLEGEQLIAVDEQGVVTRKHA